MFYIELLIIACLVSVAAYQAWFQPDKIYDCQVMTVGGYRAPTSCKFLQSINNTGEGLKRGLEYDLSRLTTTTTTTATSVHYQCPNCPPLQECICPLCTSGTAGTTSTTTPSTIAGTTTTTIIDSISKAYPASIALKWRECFKDSDCCLHATGCCPCEQFAGKVEGIRCSLIPKFEEKLNCTDIDLYCKPKPGNCNYGVACIPKYYGEYVGNFCEKI